MQSFSQSVIQLPFTYSVSLSSITHILVTQRKRERERARRRLTFAVSAWYSPLRKKWRKRMMNLCTSPCFCSSCVRFGASCFAGSRLFRCLLFLGSSRFLLLLFHVQWVFVYVSVCFSLDSMFLCLAFSSLCCSCFGGFYVSRVFVFVSVSPSGSLFLCPRILIIITLLLLEFPCI